MSAESYRLILMDVYKKAYLALSTSSISKDLKEFKIIKEEKELVPLRLRYVFQMPSDKRYLPVNKYISSTTQIAN
jgi:hypothetical protein